MIYLTSFQKGLNKTVNDVKNLRTNNDLSKSNLDDISNVVIRGTKEIFTEIYNWTMLQETNEDEDSWKSRESIILIFKTYMI